MLTNARAARVTAQCPAYSAKIKGAKGARTRRQLGGLQTDKGTKLDFVPL